MAVLSSGYRGYNNGFQFLSRTEIKEKFQRNKIVNFLEKKSIIYLLSILSFSEMCYSCLNFWIFKRTVMKYSEFQVPDVFSVL
jgi:hypothetical protein